MDELLLRRDRPRKQFCLACGVWGHSYCQPYCKSCGVYGHADCAYFCYACKVSGHPTCQLYCDECDVVGHSSRSHYCVVCGGRHGYCFPECARRIELEQRRVDELERAEERRLAELERLQARNERIKIEQKIMEL